MTFFRVWHGVAFGCHIFCMVGLGFLVDCLGNEWRVQVNIGPFSLFVENA